MRLKLIVAIILLSAIYSIVIACSCIYRTTQEYIESADAVFVCEPLSKAPTVAKSWMRYKYKLLVHALYKGDITSDTTIILTGQGGGDCGVAFEIGKRYIVYGHLYQNTTHIPNEFSTSTCSGTTISTPERITEIEKIVKQKAR
jgi:hypothetical protein